MKILFFCLFLTLSLGSSADEFQNISIEMDENSFFGQGVLVFREAEVVNDHEDYNYCHWFLISKTKAITNAHCVKYSEKFDNEKDCTNNIAGFFQTRQGVVKRTCKRIESLVWAMDIFGPDFAIIELNEPVVNADIHNIHQELITPGTKVTIPTFLVSARELKVKTTSRELTCIAHQDPEIHFFYDSSSTTTYLFDEDFLSCSIAGGMSGSPLRVQGKTVGIAQARINFDSRDPRKITHFPRRRGLTVGTSFALGISNQNLGYYTVSSRLADDFFSNFKEREEVLILEAMKPEDLWNLDQYFEGEIKLEKIYYSNGETYYYHATYHPKCAKKAIFGKSDKEIDLSFKEVNTFEVEPYLFSPIDSVENPRRQYKKIGVVRLTRSRNRRATLPNVQIEITERISSYPYVKETVQYIPWCTQE